MLFKSTIAAKHNFPPIFLPQKPRKWKENQQKNWQKFAQFHENQTLDKRKEERLYLIEHARQNHDGANFSHFLSEPRTFLIELLCELIALT